MWSHCGHTALKELCEDNPTTVSLLAMEPWGKKEIFNSGLGWIHFLKQTHQSFICRVKWHNTFWHKGRNLRKARERPSTVLGSKSVPSSRSTESDDIRGPPTITALGGEAGCEGRESDGSATWVRTEEEGMSPCCDKLINLSCECDCVPQNLLSFTDSKVLSLVLKTLTSLVKSAQNTYKRDWISSKLEVVKAEMNLLEVEHQD